MEKKGCNFANLRNPLTGLKPNTLRKDLENGSIATNCMNLVRLTDLKTPSSTICICILVILLDLLT